MKTYTLRLLNGYSKTYFNALGIGQLTEDTITFTCTGCKIVKGRSRFFNDKELIADCSLDSILWLPLGEKIEVEESSVDIDSLSLSYKDTFHYTVKVEDDTFDIHAHSVVYIGTNYYFYDTLGDLVYTLPYAYTEFLPNNIVPSNLRIWNPFTGTMSDEAFYRNHLVINGIPGKNGTSGTSGIGSNGNSGTSGTSGMRGKDAENHISYITRKLTDDELSNLKTSPVTLLQLEDNQAIDIMSATLVTQLITPEVDYDLALYLGDTVIGGWQNALDSKCVQKCILFDDVKYEMGKSLILKTVKDFEIKDSIVSLYISYRSLV